MAGETEALQRGTRSFLVQCRGGHCVAQQQLRVLGLKVILNYTENPRLARVIQDPVKSSREKRQLAAAPGLLYQPEAQAELLELPAWFSHGLGRLLEPQSPSHSGVILSV